MSVPHRLARISHQVPAADDDAQRPAAFSRLGVLDVQPSMPPPPSGRKHHWARYLAALATKPVEKYGLALALVALLLVTPGAGAEKLYYDSRDEIPLAYRWNLEDIFSSVEDFAAAAESFEKALPQLAGFQGRLAESPEVFAEAMELRYRLERDLDDLFVYANQWQSTDTRNAEANRLQGRAAGLRASFTETASFIEPEISQIPDGTLKAMLQDPRNLTYAHMVDNVVRKKAHIRSREVEKVLAAASLLRGAPARVYNSLTAADITWPTITGEDGEEETVIPALYYSFMASQDRRVRKDAALALFSTYSAHGSTLAGTLAASIHKDVWLASTRGYDSSLQAALDKINVPRSVMDTLVGTVHDNLDAIHRYVALRKKVLALDDFHIYDLYVSMVPAGEKTYTFDEGWQLATAFWRETFGDEYAAVAERGRKERWIDVYPSAGKRGGAYAWGSFDSHPYLFLNWGGTVEDVFTLVHEMGHAIHRCLATENQPYHASDYSLFVAEVASVASESLFFEWLLNRTEDPTERLAMLNLRMNNITGTFLRQIFFHEFEASAHAMAERGEPLTKESLDQVWGDLWQSYYGPEATLDDEYRSGWARIPHFYRTFYVWVYASSFAAGEAIAGRFRAGDVNAVDDYLETLKLGGSVYAMDALARAGVDMRNPDVIQTVMDRYREILAEMEKLLD